MSTLATTNLKHASSGSNNIVLASDGTTTIAAPSNIIKSGTAVASTSGTAIDFTGIPSWVKRITVMFSGVSINGTSTLITQIGGSSIETSSYTSAVTYAGLSTATITATSGFIANPSTTAAELFYGTVSMFLIDPSSNTWCSTTIGQFDQGGGWYSTCGAGSKAITGSLQRVRITTAGGTATFDAGTVNILYEG
jgi:hypothetical protein